MTYARFRTPPGPHSGAYKNGDAIRDDHRLPHLQRRWATQPFVTPPVPPDGIYRGVCPPEAAEAQRIIDTLDSLSEIL